ncbi:imm11 family protein [Sinorhizobium chiapasense]|uniref:Immunity MXAN-0049 protein domain-containing protein n=1 Tax=Sinorhizobium chiapasense TaxID=501572 RepID=A0ABZ2BHQ3_9HYPH
MAWKIGFDYVSAQPDFSIDKHNNGTEPWGFGWSWGAGRSLVGHPVPTSATQTDSNTLVDVFPMPGFACVSERFRTIVEAFEPGVHEFFPILLKSRKGAPHEEPYFLINVCQRFDSILVKGISLEWGRRVAGGLEGMPYLSRMGTKPPLPVSRTTIAGRHLWLNYWVWEGGGIMVSDQLRSALMDAKIRRLKFKEPRAEHFDEVDTPFDYRGQVPHIVDWMEKNRPATMFERDPDWVKTYMPHWLH